MGLSGFSPARLMRCFYLPEVTFRTGDVIMLPSDLLKHVKKILRLQPGTQLQLFDGHGRVAEALLAETGRAEITQIVYHPVSACQLTLIQGLPKGEKPELILQKGTELGVNHFILVEMERSLSQVKAERKERRLDRWQKIVQEAARQCKQYHLPELTLTKSLKDALSEVEADEKILLWEESGVPLVTVLPQSTPQRIAVMVGPEGGISSQEASLAEKMGYKTVSLGPRILRTETAGLAIMSILQYLYGDLASGQKG
jgi:16S rRNA (uracil1498-N3)-methyltransferase